MTVKHRRRFWVGKIAALMVGAALPLLIAKSLAEAASDVASPQNWKAQWDKTVAAAKQEGKLVINLQPGQVFRDWVANFEKKYPEIRLETAALFGADFVSRALPERRAGQYLWDIHVGGPESSHGGLVPAGAVEPLRPALLLPEVLDDSKWLGGFNAGFTDKEGKYVYCIMADVTYQVFVNRDSVPEAQLSRTEELLDPRWKGKLSIYDPRIPGKGSVDAGHWVMVKGEEWWRQLLAQRPVATKDRRQQVEWLIRGQYPIAISSDTTTLTEFKRQGLGLNVKPLDPESDMGQRLGMSFVFIIMNRAPHQNAARLFANWVLTREAQEAYVKHTERNSRRLDVTKVAETAPNPRRKYPPSINLQEYGRFDHRAQAIAREMLK